MAPALPTGFVKPRASSRLDLPHWCAAGKLNLGPVAFILSRRWLRDLQNRLASWRSPALETNRPSQPIDQFLLCERILDRRARRGGSTPGWSRERVDPCPPKADRGRPVMEVARSALYWRIVSIDPAPADRRHISAPTAISAATDRRIQPLACVSALSQRYRSIFMPKHGRRIAMDQPN